MTTLKTNYGELPLVMDPTTGRARLVGGGVDGRHATEQSGAVSRLRFNKPDAGSIPAPSPDNPFIAFRVYGIPQTKGSAKGFVGRSKKTGKLRAFITNDNTKNKGWAETVSGEAQLARRVHHLAAPFAGAIRLELEFYVKKPKSYPKTKELPAIKKPDLDKMIRSVKDALTGIFYLDDSQVVEESASKHYGDSPGALIRIREVSCN